MFFFFFFLFDEQMAQSLGFMNTYTAQKKLHIENVNDR